jgi:predicted RNA methylase
MSDKRSAYFAHARLIRGTRYEARLRHQMHFLYDRIDFLGKRVLDIGGGSGQHALYAAVSGASSVVMLEPESDGGHAEMQTRFEQWRSAIGADNTTLIDTTVQEFVDRGPGYDIILIQDAINHFDEPACIQLRHSAASRAAYQTIFSIISRLVVAGGQLMLADCSSHNLFPRLGLRNPVDPSIEWHKHQPPEIWVELAREGGFVPERTRWSAPARLGALGQRVLGNRVAAYCFTSHFVIDLLKAR